MDLLWLFLHVVTHLSLTGSVICVAVGVIGLGVYAVARPATITGIDWILLTWIAAGVAVLGYLP